MMHILIALLCQCDVLFAQGLMAAGPVPLHHTPGMRFRAAGTRVCVHVCMYVRTYVCKYVFIYECEGVLVYPYTIIVEYTYACICVSFA